MNIIRVANIKFARFTAFILALLNLLIGISYTFFIHAHSLENGQGYVHSHPFANKDNSPETNHNHDNSVLLIIPDLSKSISQTAEDFKFETFNLLVITFFVHTEKTLHQGNFHYLRGPPQKF